MAKSKKILSGNGWSFEPAGGGETRGEPLSLPPDRQKAGVKLEKRPKGKTATVVSGFVLSGEDRRALTARLKKACGSGGTEDEGKIEIQGDHRQAVASFLAKLGWSVR